MGKLCRISWKAAIFTAMLFSLAGIPLTAGFIGKFYVLSAGIMEGYWLLSIVLIVSSVIGLFYYLRIIVEMFKVPEAGYKLPAKVNLLFGGGFVLFIIFVLVLWLGIIPGFASGLIHLLVGNFM